MPYRETPIIGERSSLDPYGFLLPSELEAVVGSGLQIVEPLPVSSFIPEAPMSWAFTWIPWTNSEISYADVGRYRMFRVQPRTLGQLLHVRHGHDELIHLPEGYVRVSDVTYRISQCDGSNWVITRVTNHGRGRPWEAAVELCNVSANGRRTRNGGAPVLRFIRTENTRRTTALSDIIADPFAWLIHLRNSISRCVICNERITTPRLAHATCPSAGWTIPTPRGGTIYNCPCDACWDIRGGH